MDTINGGLHFESTLDNKKLKKGVDESLDALGKLGKEAEKQSSIMDTAFKKIGAAVGGIFAVSQAKSFIDSVIKMRSEVESLEISFATLLGDKQKADALFGSIRQFAANTPMMLNDLAKGAQMLLSFNVNAEKVMPTLKALGDISMGDSQKFNSLTLAFSQMSSTGKLMGQDLLQMINAGFNPLSVISEKTGKSIATLKEEMAKGAISSEMVTQAFMDATSEGGKFFGMLEKQSKGMAGSISNLQGAWDDMLNDIGTKMQGVSSKVVLSATDIVRNYERVGKALLELAGIVGTYKASLIALNVVQSISASLTAGWTIKELAHYRAILLVEKAQKALNATLMKNPYTLIAAAVTAAAFALYKFITAETDMEKAAKRAAEASKQFESSLASELTVLDIMFNRLKSAKEGTREYAKAKKEIQDKYGSYLADMRSEVASLEDLTAAQKELAEAIRETAAARARDNFIQSESDIASEKMTDALKKMRDAIIAEKGQSIGDELFKQVKDAWESGQYRQGIETLRGNGLGDLTKGPMGSTWGDYQLLFKQWEEGSNRIKGIAKEAESLFGAGTAKKEEVTESEAKAEITKNKKYWEDKKQEAEAQLEALTDIEAKGAKGQELKAKITEYQSKIDLYSAAKPSKSYASSDNGEQDRIDRIKDYTESVAFAARQSEMAITQAEIDAMDEGMEKHLKQNKLNYDRMLLENEKRQNEMVAAYREYLMDLWKQDNPDAGKNEQKAKRVELESVGVEQLPQTQKQIIEEYAKVAQETFLTANQNALNTALSQVMDYTQKRRKIEEDAAKEIAGMYEMGQDGKKQFRQGFGQGNVQEVEYKRDQTLAAIDEQFALREESYQAWCNEVANMTLEQLEIVLQQARKELEEAQNGSGNKDLATARAKVAKAQSQIKKVKKEDTSPDKRSIKEWEDLYKVLNEVSRTFKKVGDTIGGVAGDIVSMAGEISASTVSMISGIMQLTQGSITGIELTARASAEAIKSVERASVILAIVSAAFEIAQKIVSFISGNQDKQHQEEIAALQSRVDQLQWELDNADAAKLQKSVGDDFAKLAKEATEKLKLAGDILLQALTGIKETRTKVQVLTFYVDKLAKGFVAVEYTADKALGMKKYDEARDKLKNLAEQQIVLQQMINSESSVKEKKKDGAAIEDWQRQQIEKYTEAVQIINELYEDLMGGGPESWAKELGDAFWDAFGEGEDAATAWGKKVDEIIGSVVKKMMVQRFLEEPLGDIFDKYKSRIFNEDGSMRSMIEFDIAMLGMADEIKGLVGNFSEAFSNLPSELKEIVIGDVNDTREAAEKGIATASQDSVDELNGRMTAVQGHTYSIAENTKILVANTADILDTVNTIERHTRRLEAMENGIAGISSKMDNISRLGIKIK